MYASLIPGILFGLIGLYIIFWFCKMLLQQFFGPFSFKDYKNKRLIRESETSLVKARELHANGKSEQALEAMKGAFIFHTGPFSYEMIGMITNQHMACLHLILEVRDGVGVKLDDLPILEELIQVRSGMLKAYSDTVSSLRKLSFKRDSAKAPAWARNEFKAKEKELKTKLEDNINSIKKIYVSIGNDLTSNNQTHDYH